MDKFKFGFSGKQKYFNKFLNDLAKKADIKYTTLMKVESGTVNKPSVQTMAKIAKALRFNRRFDKIN